MVPYQRPIPESKSRGNGAGGIFGAWIQAEKMVQIALLLPCAAFIGWLGGAWLDHALHQTWISMAGIVLGIVSGLVGAVRMAVVYSSGSGQESPDQARKNGDNGGTGNSEPRS